MSKCNWPKQPRTFIISHETKLRGIIKDSFLALLSSVYWFCFRPVPLMVTEAVAVISNFISKRQEGHFFSHISVLSVRRTLPKALRSFPPQFPLTEKASI